MNKKEMVHENLAGYLFVAPSLIIFLVFLLFPIISSVFLSFTEWNFLSGFKGIKMVGFDNFKEILADKKMAFALKNTFVYVISIVPESILIAMILAYVLNSEIFAKKVLRFIFFIPYISSQVALAAVFKFLFRDDGILNEILVKGLHLMSSGPSWLSNPALNKIPICLLSIWSSIGYELIIYMAALQGVSTSLYEAADMEGANGLQKFTKITFPLITPTTFYLLVVRIIAIFKIFSSINIMTLGTYFDSNTSMVNEIYTNSFVSYKFGYASAEALVLVLLILAVTGLNFFLQKKWVNYD